MAPQLMQMNAIMWNPISSHNPIIKSQICTALTLALFLYTKSRRALWTICFSIKPSYWLLISLFRCVTHMKRWAFSFRFTFYFYSLLLTHASALNLILNSNFLNWFLFLHLHESTPCTMHTLIFNTIPCLFTLHPKNAPTYL